MIRCRSLWLAAFAALAGPLRLSLLMLLAVLAGTAHAEELGPICPDRPGKGTSPCTVAPGHVQIELGLDDLSIQHRGASPHASMTQATFSPRLA